jgi:hypothetical protein
MVNEGLAADVQLFSNLGISPPLVLKIIDARVKPDPIMFGFRHESLPLTPCL